MVSRPNIKLLSLNQKNFAHAVALHAIQQIYQYMVNYVAAAFIIGGTEKSLSETNEFVMK